MTIPPEVIEEIEREAERYATGNHSVSFADTSDQKAYSAGAEAFYLRGLRDAVESEEVKGLVESPKCAQTEFDARGGQGFLGAAIESYMEKALKKFRERFGWGKMEQLK